MNILIYYPYNHRSVEQQSVAEMLVKAGHQVVFFTTCEKGYIHDYLKSVGIPAYYTYGPTHGIQAYVKNIRKLNSIIKEKKIDVVIAQQQYPALIAGVLRLFKKFKLVYVRHNSDEDYQLNAVKAKWFNKIINALTPVKVAPSSIVQKFWIEKEMVSPKQIRRINYGYNFNQYEKANEGEARNIQKIFPAALLILSMARLVPSKRHKEMFSVVKRLVEEGIDCKMICLGTGSLENELRQIIDISGMKNHIFLLGRKENIFDYIAACDVFFHLSSAEASNSAVKEVALYQKPVIVCKGVGDFEDYIIPWENGFLVDKENPVEESHSILKAIAENKVDRSKLGQRLFNTVTTMFDIKNVSEDYNRLLHYVMQQ